MYQTSRSLFSNLCTIIFLFCIDEFFINTLHSSTIAPSYLFIIHAPQSYIILDTLHLYVVLISHSCIIFFYYPCIIYMDLQSLAYFFLIYILHSFLIYLSHSFFIHILHFSITYISYIWPHSYQLVFSPFHVPDQTSSSLIKRYKQMGIRHSYFHIDISSLVQFLIA